MLRWGGRVALCSLLTGCSPTAVFGCDDDAQCTQDGAAGTCELNGFCSFEDGECDSRRRYGELAGNGLAGRCVLEPEQDAGTGSPGSGEEASGSTLPDPSGTTGAPTTTTLTTTTSASSTGAGESSSGEGGRRPAAMPEDGLVLRLSFEEEADTTLGAYDLSGHELDAFCRTGECPVQVKGAVGYGMSFDGITDRLDVEDHPLLRLTETFSLSAWMYYEGVGDLSLALGKPFEANDRNSYELYVDHGMTPLLRFGMDSNPEGPGYVSNQALFAPAQWRHVVATYDSGVMVLYIDNVVASEGTAAPPLYDAQPLTIGGDIAGNELLYHWRGVIDEVRIYDRVLTHGEVEVLFGEGEVGR